MVWLAQSLSDTARLAVPLTISEATGPLPVLAASTCNDADLVTNMRAPTAATGEIIWLEGQVRDSYGKPIPDVLIECWHCNAFGRYHDPNENDSSLPLDPGFLGFGRCLSDSEGYYRFRTVRPGKRATRRARHIHLSVMGNSWLSRLFVHVYFGDDSEKVFDPVFTSLCNDDQERLIAEPQSVGAEDRAPVYRYDIVLPVAVQAGSVGTPPCTIGRFFRAGLLREALGVNFNRLWTDGTYGQRIRVEAELSLGTSNALPDILVELWQANGWGRYHHPADGRRLPYDPAFIGFGRCAARAGRFVFETVKPGAIEDGGRVVCAPHINVRFVFPWDRRLYYTRIYFQEDVELLAEDLVVGELVRSGRRFSLARKTGEVEGIACYRWEARVSDGGECAVVFFELRG